MKRHLVSYLVAGLGITFLLVALCATSRMIGLICVGWFSTQKWHLRWDTDYGTHYADNLLLGEIDESVCYMTSLGVSSGHITSLGVC